MKTLPSANTSQGGQKVSFFGAEKGSEKSTPYPEVPLRLTKIGSV
jgi:hypothetical protein